MAKAKKKKSKAKTAIITIAVLGAIGAVMPDEETETPAGSISSSSVSTIESSENVASSQENSVENIIEEDTSQNIGQTAETSPGNPTEDTQINNSAPQETTNTAEISPQPEPEPETTTNVAVDPESAFREKLMQYNYVGSADSDKYHYPDCRWTNKINDNNLVHFDTEDEANAAGYKPCGTCNP